MGSVRWLFESFGAGAVRQAYAVRPSTRESKEGVSEATNARILPDGSITQAPGSYYHRSISNTYTSSRLFPYSVAGEEYQIEVKVQASGGVIQIFQKVGGAWSSTPLEGWDSYITQQGDGEPGDFVNVSLNPPGSAYLGVPWAEDELGELRHVQHGRTLLLLHPEYPPYRIEKEPSGQWLIDPFAYHDGGGEIGSVGRGTTLSATGITGAAVLSTGAILTANQPIFDSKHDKANNSALETYSLPSGANADDQGRKLTSIWRVGTHADRNWPFPYLGHGNFFTVQQVRSQYSALAMWVSAYYGTGTGSTDRHKYAFDAPEEWAGPWEYEAGTFPSLDINVSCEPGEMFSLEDADVFGVDESMVGDIFVWDQSGTTQFVQLHYHQPSLDGGVTPGTWFFQNIGSNGTLNNTSAVVETYRWALQDKDKHIQIFPETSSVMVRKSVHTPVGAIPDGHEEHFERVGFKHLIAAGSTNEGLGGAIYANGGVFRTSSRVTDTVTNEDTPAYLGYWTKKPRSHGPIRGFGWGPSKAAGFPDVGTVHQGRLALAGFKQESSAITLSAVGDPLDLRTDPDRPSDGPLNFALTEAAGERVRALASFTSLFVGTDFAEYQITGAPISGNDATVNKVSRYGGRNAGVARVGSSVLFVTNDGKAVRQYRRSDEIQGFTAEDILQSSSVLQPGDGITQMVQQSGDENLVWCRTELGELLLLQHSEETNVRGWSRVAFPDTLVDLVEVLDDAGSQAIWGVFQSANGTKRIERFDATIVGWRSVTTTQNTATVAQGFNTLAGREVEVFIDGAYKGRRTVTTGGQFSITGMGLTGVPSAVEARLPCEMTVGLHVYPFTGAAGPTAAKKFQIRLVNVFIEDSYGGRVSGARVKPVTTSGTNEPFTGWVPVAGSGGSPGLFPIIEVTTVEPLPFRLAAAVLDGTHQSS